MKLKKKTKKRDSLIILGGLLLFVLIGSIYVLKTPVLEEEIVAESGMNEQIVLNIGDEVKLEDYVEYLDMVESTTFSEEGILSIDEEYTIKAVKEGSSKLTVKYNNGESEEFDFTSSYTTFKVNIGDNANLKDMVPSFEEVKTYKFSEEGIFTVDNDYKITAIQEGDVKLTVDYNDGEKRVLKLVSTVQTSNATATGTAILVQLNDSLVNDFGFIYLIYGKGVYNVYDPKNYSEKNKMTTTKNPLPLNRIGQSKKLKKGYVYAGYYTKPNGQGKKMINSSGYITTEFTAKAFDKNTVLYPKYVLSENLVYEIELSPKTGDNPAIEKLYTKYGKYYYKNSGMKKNAQVTKITIPKKSGYTFEGYYTGQNGTGKQIIDASGNLLKVKNTNFRGDSIIYAHWTKESQVYKINLIATEADTSKGTTEVYEKYNSRLCLDKECKKPLAISTITSGTAIVKPQRKYYTFSGYYTKTNGQGVQLIDNNGKATSKFTTTYFKSDSSLYAKWTPTSQKVYTITLNGQNDSVNYIYEAYGKEIYDSKGKTINSTNKVAKPKKNGFEFMGYYTATNGQGVKLIDESGKLTSTFTNTYFNKNATLYAYWSYPYTDTINGYRCDTKTLKKLYITTCQSSNVSGALCNYSNGGSSKVIGTVLRNNLINSLDKCVESMAEVTLSAKGSDKGYAGTSKIYYKYNDGVYLDSGYTKKMTTKKNPITTPYKKGYEFIGYYTESNGKGMHLIDQRGYITSAFTNTLFKKNTILYAYYVKPGVINYEKDSNGKFTFVNNPEGINGDQLTDYDKGNRLVYQDTFNGNLELYFEHSTYDATNYREGFYYAVRFRNDNKTTVKLKINKSGTTITNNAPIWGETFVKYHSGKNVTPKDEYDIKPGKTLYFFMSAKQNNHKCDKNFIYANADNFDSYFTNDVNDALCLSNYIGWDGVLNVTSNGKLTYENLIFTDFNKISKATYPGNIDGNPNAWHYAASANYSADFYNNALFVINDDVQKDTNLYVTDKNNNKKPYWVTNSVYSTDSREVPCDEKLYALNKKDGKCYVPAYSYQDDVMPLRIPVPKSQGSGLDYITVVPYKKNTDIDPRTGQEFNSANWGVHYHDNITIINNGSKARTISFKMIPMYSNSGTTYEIWQDTSNDSGTFTPITRDNKHFRSTISRNSETIWRVEVPAGASATIPAIITIGGQSSGTIIKYLYVEE